jgi:hypothetical protein
MFAAQYQAEPSISSLAKRNLPNKQAMLVAIIKVHAWFIDVLNFIAFRQRRMPLFGIGFAELIILLVILVLGALGMGIFLLAIYWVVRAANRADHRDQDDNANSLPSNH